jgi:quinolinate synthase
MIVATETGIRHRMQRESPESRLIPANVAAVGQDKQMITLPKLRDSLRAMKYEVRVSPDVAERARLPIERMVSIG